MELDRQLAIAKLMEWRDRTQLTPTEINSTEEALRRNILTLWRTRAVRATKPTVVDEINNGLFYYDQTFFDQLPRLYAQFEELLTKHNVGEGIREIPSFLRIGSWIGGDRDGNPYVNAEMLRTALRMQSTHALNYYLEQLHHLSAELSLSNILVNVSDDLKSLAKDSPDIKPEYAGEPYRRAIAGMYSRLAKTASQLNNINPIRELIDQAKPYRNSDEFTTDLNIIHQSLVTYGATRLANGRLHHLRRAVDIFDFHLAALDMRQNSDVLERVVTELLHIGSNGTNYQGLNERSNRPLAAMRLKETRCGETVR